MRRILLVLGLCALVVSGMSGCGDGETNVAGTGAVDGGDAGGAGGMGDGGQCYTASFVSPKDGAQLTEASDSDKNCSNGFTTDITVAVAAPDGTSVQLLLGGAQIASGTISGASATFSNAPLDTGTSSTLTLRIGDNPSCDITATFTVNCNVPSCSISKPVLSPTHPKLNGVPVAQGGDRASAAGTPYQAAFEVTTNIADGQPVSISVDGSSTLTTTTAQGGVAQFAGVTLSPDGDHSVQATCTDTGGKVGTSAPKTFPVDSTPPDLTIAGPIDGQFFGPSDDVDPATPGLQFKVCGTTKASDAIDLPASLGSGQSNYCVGIGTSSPSCVAATTGGAAPGDGGCVTVTCPGGAAFDLGVTLSDAAGNPTTKKIQGVTCASNLPGVQIIDPIDGTGADLNTHILAASMTTTRVDQDASAPGAQYTVVACTDTQGGSAQLMAGHVGGALTQLGSPITVAAAQASDKCPSGLGYVASFKNATLPKSTEDLNGKLSAATELTVQVTAPSTAVGTSPPVDVWVDSVAPILSEWSPQPLCGANFVGTTDITKSIVLTSTSAPVSMVVKNANGTKTYNASSLQNGRADFGQVTLAFGNNDITADATELSGNKGALTSPCAVTVGNPPVVTWTSPSASTLMNAATDGDSGTAGWQGTLAVKTDVGGSGGTVQFAYDIGGTVTNLGSPVNINASGVATLANQTIPEGDPVKLIATTSNIPARGVGTATLSKTVDVTVPGAVTGLAASVKDRRQTTFHLAWTAPGDGGKAVFGYDVRVSRSAITAGNFGAATPVIYSGAPAAAGQPDGVDVANQVIETTYYFAVRAKDKAGNVSTIAAAGPTKAQFKATTLSPGVANEGFGVRVDGSTSFNGDAYSDLLVATQNGSKAYAYFGSAGGFSTKPDITFSGSAGTLFGITARVIGDIDGDGLPDLAFGAPLENTVYIFKGRSTWPATLSSSQADYVIRGDSTADPGFSSSLFGISLAYLGDFDGDGVPDFAIGAQGYGTNHGLVAIIRGVPQGTPFPALVKLPQAFGTRAIGIKGDTAFKGRFGARIVDIGKFYNTTGTTLIAAAPFAATNGANAGRVYAFHGQAGAGGFINIAGADHTADGASAGRRLGTTLASLGNMYGTSSPDLAVGAPALFSTGGRAFLHFGTPSAGPFAGASVTLTDSAASTTYDAFGFGIIGGGFSGRSVTTSFVGTSDPDVAVAALNEGGAASKIYVLDAQDAGALVGAGPSDVAAAATLSYQLPSDWRGVALGSGAIKDLNGDGYGDLAIGEFDLLANNYPGRVLVLW